MQDEFKYSWRSEKSRDRDASEERGLFALQRRRCTCPTRTTTLLHSAGVLFSPDGMVVDNGNRSGFNNYFPERTRYNNSHDYSFSP
jgi:hypothetical protein